MESTRRPVSGWFLSCDPKQGMTKPPGLGKVMKTPKFIGHCRLVLGDSGDLSGRGYTRTMVSGISRKNK